MAQSTLHYIPLALFIYFPLGLVICFIIAYQQGHINILFTFISDTGTKPPEQYIFAQFVNMGAALYAYFAYIRYLQVEQYMKIQYSQSIPMGNTVGLAFGFITALGMSIVGNFPELHMKEVHILGAFLTFVGGSIYILYQGYYTFKLLPHFGNKEMAYFRTFLGVFGLMAYFGAQATVILAFQRYKPRVVQVENGIVVPDLKWGRDDGGYEFQAASVIMEWILMADFVIFVWTFIPEFKKFKLESPPVKFQFLIKMEPTEDPERPTELQVDQEYIDGISGSDFQEQDEVWSGIGSSSDITGIGSVGDLVSEDSKSNNLIEISQSNIQV